MGWILNMWIKLGCWFLGHDPRGPVPIAQFGTPEIYYCCDRCKRIIVFDPIRGWLPLRVTVENGE